MRRENRIIRAIRERQERRLRRQAQWNALVKSLSTHTVNWVAVACLLVGLFLAVTYYIGAEAREKRRPTTTQKIVVVVTNATAPKYHFVRVN